MNPLRGSQFFLKFPQRATLESQVEIKFIISFCCSLSLCISLSLLLSQLKTSLRIAAPAQFIIIHYKFFDIFHCWTAANVVETNKDVIGRQSTLFRKERVRDTFSLRKLRDWKRERERGACQDIHTQLPIKISTKAIHNFHNLRFVWQATFGACITDFPGCVAHFLRRSQCLLSLRTAERLLT